MIEKTLLEHIKDRNTFFIFPTQLAADSWQDRIIQISDVKAVASERFIAWDKFKAESIKSKHQVKTAVPSTMRKIFASTVIQENAKSPFLKSIIVPEYAKTAGGFLNWITNLLPSLSLWKKYFESSGAPADEQDQDLLRLYDLYKTFLENHNLFDPAWETPPFEPDGHKYFIFYPEILSDYAEYEIILKDSPDITIINLEKNDDKKPDVLLFANSRIEIKNIANYIRNAHYKNNIPWNQIAISIPEIETYGPYLERELSLLEIPHVLRNATPLSSTGAGNLFASLQECYSNDFAYDSLKALLLNTELPWKDKDTISQLLDFGKKNHCICSFEDNGQKVDVWKESFKLNPNEERACRLYENLKRSITTIVTADSFSKISENYFIFKNDFFDSEKFTKRTDLILSRCVIELGGLIDLEKQYNFTLPNPFSFFTEYLGDVQYLENKEELGVNLLPYKTGSCVPYACHIIVDSSQAALSVIYKQLSFLREDKRQKLLKREDSNITENFIRLYTMHSTKQPAYFTAAAKTFDSYAQASSYLTEVDCIKDFKPQDYFGDNPYIAEKEWMLEQGEFPEPVTETEKVSFDNWLEYQEGNVDEGDLLLKLKEKLLHDKLYVTKSSLNVFYECPRQFLFQQYIKPSEEDNTAVLIDNRLIGNVYHKVFELFLSALKENDLPIHIDSDTNEFPADYAEFLTDSINKAVITTDTVFLQKKLLQTTVQAVADGIIPAVKYFSKVFEGCKIHATEGKYKYEPENKDYVLYGIIDCLLQDPLTSEYYLVDYKKSAYSIPKTKELYFDPDENNVPDFQIPVYVEILKQGSKINVQNAGFLNINECKIVTVFGTSLAARAGKKKADETKELEDFIPTIDKVNELAEHFSDCVNRFDFSLTDEVPEFKTCAKCSYNAICRKTFNVNRKN